MAVQVTISAEDRIAGLANANAMLNQRCVDLEIAVAALRRTITEREVSDASKEGKEQASQSGKS